MSLLNSSDRVSLGLDQRAMAGRLTPWLYAVTLFVSALLLFSIQPMFAKMVLPKLGGAPYAETAHQPMSIGVSGQQHGLEEDHCRRPDSW